MVLKNTWATGESYTATAANDVATQVNTNTTDIAGKQASDADLTTIAGLTATTDNVIQSVASAWASRTPAQLKATLALVKGDVGLGNVTNNAQYFPGGTDVAVADGGTGVSTLTTNGVVLGNGTSAVQTVAPSTAGYILGTDGTTWTAQPLTRVTSITSSATPSLNTDTTDQLNITALAVAITSMTSGLSGTPRDAQRVMIRITGTATRTITWGTSFASSGVATLLATTSGTNTHLVGLQYDSTKAKWICIAVDATGY